MTVPGFNDWVSPIKVFIVGDRQHPGNFHKRTVKQPYINQIVISWRRKHASNVNQKIVRRQAETGDFRRVGEKSQIAVCAQDLLFILFVSIFDKQACQ